jgi:hypothetical protein
MKERMDKELGVIKISASYYAKDLLIPIVLDILYTLLIKFLVLLN